MVKPVEKVPVYLMPGMAASSLIFKNIKLPEDRFDCHYLEWIIPEKGESLQEYASRMSQYIKHKDPVLIGVSFGGILVQEMAKIIPVRKLIVISSVKSTKELPKRMLFARYTNAHKILPTGLANNIELLAKYAFGDVVTKRLDLYQQYLSVRDKYYLDWSIDKVVNWKQEKPLPDVVHIHGEKDAVFPRAYIDDCIEVPGGTHVMIINRFKWFNENLPRLILEE
ncbi:Pimeloyl-ACP methyl ester carboxylesterase [Zhouia amylolytica]|uniref:AB hydrolase-1 domain-containing protein n=2 Tax=Zhouia amylolytica TaxID=376730 RepID=W2URL8_9FLAO|nr:alpha/beta hydrolase [Zhouia amylolytica]ETN95962.1 hypothetical protein P278_16840 [Zhouia amylolytica AD3]MCQ0111250.1 alpha/beta hydrolase [Zhouia amylolytica]SFS52248.1 Pimeloyl-ACP methyl ester carboxylesterase [Zhouia amylolytica]